MPSSHPFSIAFDHHSPQFREDPVGVYEEIRNTCPVAWTDSYDGFWITTRYRDIQRIARDDATFSSARASSPGEGTAMVIPQGAGLEQYPIELDPPDSRPYRDLINPMLTPEAVEKLVPMIERHTTQAINAFIESGEADLVQALTNPVPTAVTLEWLGFPSDDWKRLAGPVHDIFAAAPGSERARRGGEALGFMADRILELIAARRAEPRDDGISYLVAQCRPNGEPFSDEELLKVAGLLVAGGVDTTTSLTGSTLLHLSTHPEDRQRLIEEPGLIEVATEEFLRAFAPSQSMARTIMADTEISGCPVRRGERVLIPWVAANYDPEVFEDPQRVKLDRNPIGHLSFGTGSHRCAGAHLARAMFRSMITQVLTRLPDYVIDVDRIMQNESVGNQAGWDSLPATFTPGPRWAVASSSASSRFETRLCTVAERVEVADGIVALTLAPEAGSSMVEWQPGAHIDLILPSGRVRQYSLCGVPGESAYRIAVLREVSGRGGSAEVHADVAAGSTVRVRGPRNAFPLVEAQEYLFIAGGIGITPLLPMIRQLQAQGREWTLLYGGRTRASMAFVDELQALGGERVRIVPQDEHGHPDLAGALAGHGPSTAVYCCGPEGLLRAVENAVAAIPSGPRLHLERFTTPGDRVEPIPADATAFDVELARTGVTVHVAENQTVLDAVRAVMPGLAFDCLAGHCGSCETRVLAGVPDHRDRVLTDEERASGDSMMLCVSRCRGEQIVLDL